MACCRPPIGSSLISMSGDHSPLRPCAAQVLGDVACYDTQANAWVQPSVAAGSLPPARNAATLVQLRSGQLMLHGGWVPFVQSFKDTYLFSSA